LVLALMPFIAANRISFNLLSVLTSNSAVADKLRDTFVQYAMA